MPLKIFNFPNRLENLQGSKRQENWQLIGNCANWFIRPVLEIPVRPDSKLLHHGVQVCAGINDHPANPMMSDVSPPSPVRQRPQTNLQISCGLAWAHEVVWYWRVILNGPQSLRNPALPFVIEHRVQIVGEQHDRTVETRRINDFNSIFHISFPNTVIIVVVAAAPRSNPRLPDSWYSPRCRGRQHGYDRILLIPEP